MKTVTEIEPLIRSVVAWAEQDPRVLAVGLVGSYARGAAREDSDIDFVLIVSNVQPFLTHTGWVGQFGQPQKQQVEAYGLVTSLRVWYTGGPEVEFGLTTPVWVAQPLDEGTRRVIADGLQILYERDRLFSAII